MIDAFTVQHYEHASDRSFEEVVAAFEAATGSVEKGELNAAIRETESLSEFEAKVQSFEGESGFMRFMMADHAGWLHHFGVNAKARTSSSLLSRLRKEELMVSAGKLDEKLRLLAEPSTGAAA